MFAWRSGDVPCEAPAIQGGRVQPVWPCYHTIMCPKSADREAHHSRHGARERRAGLLWAKAEKAPSTNGARLRAVLAGTLVAFQPI
jgi:hypothetical protein